MRTIVGGGLRGSTGGAGAAAMDSSSAPRPELDFAVGMELFVPGSGLNGARATRLGVTDRWNSIWFAAGGGKSSGDKSGSKTSGDIAGAPVLTRWNGFSLLVKTASATGSGSAPAETQEKQARRKLGR